MLTFDITNQQLIAEPILGSEHDNFTNFHYDFNSNSLYGFRLDSQTDFLKIDIQTGDTEVIEQFSIEVIATAYNPRDRVLYIALPEQILTYDFEKGNISNTAGSQLPDYPMGLVFDPIEQQLYARYSLLLNGSEDVAPGDAFQYYLVKFNPEDGSFEPFAEVAFNSNPDAELIDNGTYISTGYDFELNRNRVFQYDLLEGNLLNVSPQDNNTFDEYYYFGFHSLNFTF